MCYWTMDQFVRLVHLTYYMYLRDIVSFALKQILQACLGIKYCKQQF